MYNIGTVSSPVLSDCAANDHWRTFRYSVLYAFSELVPEHIRLIRARSGRFPRTVSYALHTASLSPRRSLGRLLFGLCTSTGAYKPLQPYRAKLFGFSYELLVVFLYTLWVAVIRRGPNDRFFPVKQISPFVMDLVSIKTAFRSCYGALRVPFFFCQGALRSPRS